VDAAETTTINLSTYSLNLNPVTSILMFARASVSLMPSNVMFYLESFVWQELIEISTEDEIEGVLAALRKAGGKIVSMQPVSNRSKNIPRLSHEKAKHKTSGSIFCAFVPFCGLKDVSDSYRPSQSSVACKSL